MVWGFELGVRAVSELYSLIVGCKLFFGNAVWWSASVLQGQRTSVIVSDFVLKAAT